jgi:hypothetical protein
VVKEGTEMRTTIVYRRGSTFAQQTYLTFLMLEVVRLAYRCLTAVRKAKGTYL